jgi:hypothetical protein
MFNFVVVAFLIGFQVVKRKQKSTSQRKNGRLLLVKRGLGGHRFDKTCRKILGSALREQTHRGKD